MKKQSLDGLPGLTMQGTKGPAGKRGYTTFYNYNEKFSLVTKSESGRDVYNEYSLGFTNSSENGDIDSEICIPCHFITPIIHDRLLNTVELGLDLYEVEDVIPIQLVETQRGKKIITTEYIADDLSKKYDKESESYLYIYKKLIAVAGQYIMYPESIDDVISDVEEEFNIYILKKLDTLVFSKQKSSSNLNEIEVSIKSKVLRYPEWQKTYAESDSSLNETTFDNACTTHKYNIVLDNSNANRIMDAISLIPDEDEDESFRSQINNQDKLKIRIFSSNNLKENEFITGKNVRIIGFSLPAASNAPNELFNPPEDWEEGEVINNVRKIFDVTTSVGMIDVDPVFVDDENNYRAKVIRVSCDGYWTAYYVLNKLGWNENDHYSSMIDPKNINVYLYELTADIGTSVNTKVEVTDYYPYIDTSKPVTRVVDVDENGVDIVQEKFADLAVVQFSVFMPITVKDREKTAIYAEFIKTENGTYVYNMDSVRDTLWDAPEDNTSIESIIEATEESLTYPFGKLQNYKNINFDDEDLGNFIIIAKDFNEGNSLQTYTSTKIFPEDILTNYKVILYMYYKTSNAAYQKIYLGEAEMQQSLD